jgi:tetratricopeptide (TPR) repeat protein
MDTGNIARAHDMFAMATHSDALSGEAPFANGRLYLYEYQTVYTEPNRIEAAARSLETAVSRNPAYYKYHAKLSEIYATAAQTSKSDERAQLLQKAYTSGQKAVARYPGDAVAHISLGDIADELGKKAEALEEYRKAVAIEDSYRELFVRIYAGRKLYSRLGEEKYQYARSRIVELGATQN